MLCSKRKLYRGHNGPFFRNLTTQRKLISITSFVFLRVVVVVVVITLNIVTGGTGYVTLQVSKALTKVLQFMLKVPRQRTIFCFTFAHYG